MPSKKPGITTHILTSRIATLKKLWVLQIAIGWRCTKTQIDLMMIHHRSPLLYNNLHKAHLTPNGCDVTTDDFLLRQNFLSFYFLTKDSEAITICQFIFSYSIAQIQYKLHRETTYIIIFTTTTTSTVHDDNHPVLLCSSLHAPQSYKFFSLTVRDSYTNIISFYE